MLLNDMIIKKNNLIGEIECLKGRLKQALFEAATLENKIAMEYANDNRLKEACINMMSCMSLIEERNRIFL